jgi:hypothetical protein
MPWAERCFHASLAMPDRIDSPEHKDRGVQRENLVHVLAHKVL